MMLFGKRLRKLRKEKGISQGKLAEKLGYRSNSYIADAEMEIDHYITEGAARNKIHLIPVGIDFNEFSRVERKADNSQKVILYLGRLHKLKGPDLLIKAFSLLKGNNVKLVISGIDYGFESALKSMVKDLGITDKVEWIGPCYDSQKARVYTSADVYVMPSRYEMFGLTFLEALACGTPVIMTDRCGAADLLTAECGYVVPFDETDLAYTIQAALDDNLVNKYRDYRKSWARQYDWTNLAHRHITVYEKVLNEK